MNKKLYWGLGVLFILIIGGFVFLLVQQKAELAKLKEDFALPTEKVAENENNQKTPQNGHWHGDEWHDESHEPISNQPFTDMSENIDTSNVMSIPAAVAASDDVPKYAELKAMSDEEIWALYNDSVEKRKLLSPKLWASVTAWGQAETGSHEEVSLRAVMEALTWEFNVHEITSKRAFDIHDRRLLRRNYNRPHGPGEMIIYPLPGLTD